MAVNLSGIELSGPAMGSPRQASSSQNSAASPPDAAPQTGDVNITSTAALLAHLEQTLAGQPAIDQKRVDALTQAIAAGSYRVSPDQVASGLIQSERALSRLPLAQI